MLLKPHKRKIQTVLSFIDIQAKKLGNPLTNAEIQAVLFFSDVSHLNVYGRPVTFDNYQTQADGTIQAVYASTVIGSNLEYDWDELSVSDKLILETMITTHFDNKKFGRSSLTTLLQYNNAYHNAIMRGSAPQPIQLRDMLVVEKEPGELEALFENLKLINESNVKGK